MFGVASSSPVLSEPSACCDVRRVMRDFSGLYGDGRLAPSSSEACRSGRFRLLLGGAMAIEGGRRLRRRGERGLESKCSKHVGVAQRRAFEIVIGAVVRALAEASRVFASRAVHRTMDIPTTPV